MILKTLEGKTVEYTLAEKGVTSNLLFVLNDGKKLTYNIFWEDITSWMMALLNIVTITQFAKDNDNDLRMDASKSSGNFVVTFTISNNEGKSQEDKYTFSTVDTSIILDKLKSLGTDKQRLQEELFIRATT